MEREILRLITDIQVMLQESLDEVDKRTKNLERQLEILRKFYPEEVFDDVYQE